MGREVRRVPANWQHPKKANGHYIPLFHGSFARTLREWQEGHAQWEQGFRSDYHGGWKPKEDDELSISYEEWTGACPQQADYMPDWADEERTHFQMYENTTEGTPISPVMQTAEALARWLADNKASAFGEQTATYEAWLSMIACNYAPSMAITDGQIMSGVEAMHRMHKN